MTSSIKEYNGHKVVYTLGSCMTTNDIYYRSIDGRYGIEFDVADMTVESDWEGWVLPILKTSGEGIMPVNEISSFLKDEGFKDVHIDKDGKLSYAFTDDMVGYICQKENGKIRMYIKTDSSKYDILFDNFTTWFEVVDKLILILSTY